MKTSIAQFGGAESSEFLPADFRTARNQQRFNLAATGGASVLASREPIAVLIFGSRGRSPHRNSKLCQSWRNLRIAPFDFFQYRPREGILCPKKN
jgi:hypothetical protein